MITASLKNYRQSPKKVRLMVDVIRGKKVSDALDMLTVIAKRSAFPLQKLIKSAVANASHNHGINNVDGLFIKEIRVDEGIVYHRFMPRARGSAAPIKKRTSHVLVVLDTKDSADKAHAISDRTVSAEVKEIAPVVRGEKKEKKTVAKKASSKKSVTKDKK